MGSDVALLVTDMIILWYLLLRKKNCLKFEYVEHSTDLSIHHFEYDRKWSRA